MNQMARVDLVCMTVGIDTSCADSLSQDVRSWSIMRGDCGPGDYRSVASISLPMNCWIGEVCGSSQFVKQTCAREDMQRHEQCKS